MKKPIRCQREWVQKSYWKKLFLRWLCRSFLRFFSFYHFSIHTNAFPVFQSHLFSILSLICAAGKNLGAITQCHVSSHGCGLVTFYHPHFVVLHHETIF